MAPGFAFVLLEATKAIREQDGCHSNLRITENGLAWFVYQQGSLPLTLNELVVARLVNEGNLRCPATGREYIYMFEGVPVKKGQLKPGTCVLVCRGFPHRGLKYFACWEESRHPVRHLPAGDVIDALEEDRLKLAARGKSRIVRGFGIEVGAPMG